ncbi:MAG TPA: choice-of-anchor L domain-containing protein, partial [Flavobacterium sp.]|nr:choice-of-anchor L domain-containing protein [Flavobacterium sp.]
MKLKLLSAFILLITFSARAQLVGTNTQTPAQLVQNVLLGGGVTVSNVTFNGSAIMAGQIRDQASFFNTGIIPTNIGLQSGILLTTGKGTVAIGPNNSGSTTDPTDSPMGGDADLLQIATGSINTKAVLEFDFIPLGETVTFQYVFGSEEYLEWVGSDYNDVFGFFLSGPGIAGPFSNGAVNIAVLPTTPPTPVSINNVNNVSNPLFYVNNGTGTTPAVNTSIQYDGFTTVLTATATVQCGQTYHIKLAIANVGDPSLDSGVFLKANSFNSTPLELPDDYLVANGFAPCAGGEIEICSGLGDAVVHEWYQDGVLITGVTGECYTITEPGEYCVTAYPYGPACPVTDCITIEFLPELPVQQPLDLCEESGIFNLNDNNPIILGSLSPGGYDISFYSTEQNALDAASPLNPNNYVGTEGEIVWVRIDDINSSASCFTIRSFSLSLECADGLEQCDDISNDEVAIFDLTP